jgi:hypothetical protein
MACAYEVADLVAQDSFQVVGVRSVGLQGGEPGDLLIEDDIRLFDRAFPIVSATSDASRRGD